MKQTLTTYEMKFKIHVLFQKERYLGFDTFKSVDISCNTPLQRFVGLNYLYLFLLCRHVASKGGGGLTPLFLAATFFLKFTCKIVFFMEFGCQIFIFTL